MLMAATKGDYTLFIDYDSDPLNPRTDWDPFGGMICFHRRYSLGDKHNYSDPSELLDELLDEHSGVVKKTLYRQLRNGEIKEATLTYDRHAREWVLKSYGSYTKEWYVEASYPPGLRDNNLPDDFVSTVSEFMDTGEKLDLLGMVSGLIILPLYLYDHSGITMNTSGFSCPWDSGKVGWVYATPEMIRAEYGVANAETIEKARKLLISEVNTYDHFLRGECYGFMLYEGKTETDSCWGYLGDLDAMKEDIRAELPEECRELVDLLEYCSDNSIADYFWRRAG